MQDSKSTLQPLPPLSTVTTSTGDLSRGEGTLRLLTVVKPLAVAGCHSQGRKVLKIGDIPPPRLQTRTLKLNEPSITTTTPSCFCFSATIVILCPMLFSRRKEKPTFSFSFFLFLFFSSFFSFLFFLLFFLLLSSSFFFLLSSFFFFFSHLRPCQATQRRNPSLTVSRRSTRGSLSHSFSLFS